MAGTIATNCPNCDKPFDVPEAYVGKQIKCKSCQTQFTVPAKSGPARAAKPAAAKPAPAKPAKPKEPAKDAADAPMKFADDPPAPALPGQKVSRPYDDEDDDGDANPYGVTRGDEDVPRCPRCATELDPPDTKICLECGYDMLARRRHETKKVYELTNADYFIHWLPAFVWLGVAFGVIALSVVCGLFMYDWLSETFLAKDEKNLATQQVDFYLPPFCFNIWIWVFSAAIAYKGFRFAYRRLAIDWVPAETVKK